MRARIKQAVSAVCRFLHPEAFEQRERDRQRADLVATLDTIRTMREWCDGAEPVARERLEKLNLAELGFTTTHASGAHWGAELQPPSPPKLPHGEYERVPRSLREAFGHTAGLEPMHDDGVDFGCGARVLLIGVALVIIGGVAVELWGK